MGRMAGEGFYLKRWRNGQFILMLHLIFFEIGFLVPFDIFSVHISRQISGTIHVCLIKCADCTALASINSYLPTTADHVYITRVMCYPSHLLKNLLPYYPGQYKISHACREECLLASWTWLSSAAGAPSTSSIITTRLLSNLMREAAELDRIEVVFNTITKNFFSNSFGLDYFHCLLLRCCGIFLWCKT